MILGVFITWVYWIESSLQQMLNLSPLSFMCFRLLEQVVSGESVQVWFGAGGVRKFEEVLLGVSLLDPPLPFVSSFQMWGVEPGDSGPHSYLSREVH